MKLAKVFKCGNSQAIRIPKEFQFKKNITEVEMFQKNGMLVIREVPKNLAEAFLLFSKFPEDFFADGRKDTPPQKRDFF